MPRAEKIIDADFLPAGMSIHPRPDRLKRPSRAMEAEMIRLHQSIEALVLHSRCKVIQFTGPDGREGTSSIVKAFGDVVSTRIGKSVISIDVTAVEKDGAPDDGEGFGPGTDLVEAHDHPRVTALLPRLTPRPSAVAVYGDAGPRYGSGSGQMVANLAKPSQFDSQLLFQRGALEAYWARLGGNADMILLDTPPFSVSGSAAAVAPTADGIILVIEAERSTSATIQKALQKIDRCGGQCLGIILNKKRRYLPRFLQKWV